MVFQPLVWSERSQEVINRHKSRLWCVRLLGLYPTGGEINICNAQTFDVKWLKILCESPKLPFIYAISAPATLDHQNCPHQINSTWSEIGHWWRTSGQLTKLHQQMGSSLTVINKVASTCAWIHYTPFSLSLSLSLSLSHPLSYSPRLFRCGELGTDSSA